MGRNFNYENNQKSICDTYQTAANGETDVENRFGNDLPSTGGIGTANFYVVSSILVIGAAVLLIIKKRMTGVKQAYRSRIGILIG